MFQTKKKKTGYLKKEGENLILVDIYIYIYIFTRLVLLGYSNEDNIMNVDFTFDC